jgi:hypothetical protein
MKKIPAYRRNNDGTLDMIDILDDNGSICDGLGYPLQCTGEIVELCGWPHEAAKLHITVMGGVEILVPVK